jgi:putative flippase GtrA
MRGLSRYALIGLAATTVHYVLLVVLVEAAAAPPGPADCCAAFGLCSGWPTLRCCACRWWAR